jgi:N-acetylmuramoyl-L-alanine amidase
MSARNISTQPMRPPFLPPPPVIIAPPDPMPVALSIKPELVAAKTTTTAPARNPDAPVALPAKINSNGDRSLTRVLGLKLGRVVIDPGHGGHDNGTHGATGLLEKDVVLDVAQRLGKLLEERLGSEVIFTRSDDTYIPLEERTQIANEHKADLFLSIHANSSPYRNVAGVETYYLNFTTSRTALDVATRENASSQRSVFELKDLLQKIALKDKIDESREFASRIETALYGLSVKTNTVAKNRGVKKAPFVVLIGAQMPSVLAEIGFLTNTRDESLLKKPEHRQKIAEALYKGIASYADTLSHFQVAKRD